jgi:hypothetical protein
VPPGVLVACVCVTVLPSLKACENAEALAEPEPEAVALADALA